MTCEYETPLVGFPKLSLKSNHNVMAGLNVGEVAVWSAGVSRDKV